MPPLVEELLISGRHGGAWDGAGRACLTNRWAGSRRRAPSPTRQQRSGLAPTQNQRRRMWAASAPLTTSQLKARLTRTPPR
jgi:hypothetical protein